MKPCKTIAAALRRAADAIARADVSPAELVCVTVRPTYDPDTGAKVLEVEIQVQGDRLTWENVCGGRFASREGRSCIHDTATRWGVTWSRIRDARREAP